MWILYGIYYDYYSGREETAIAEFDDLRDAHAYANRVTLEKFPNGNHRFRRGSLLSAQHSYEVREKEEISLPRNPIPPASPPDMEYIAVLTDRFDGKVYRFNHGRNREEAERDVKEHKERTGGEATLEERYI